MNKLRKGMLEILADFDKKKSRNLMEVWSSCVKYDVVLVNAIWINERDYPCIILVIILADIPLMPLKIF